MENLIHVGKMGLPSFTIDENTVISPRTSPSCIYEVRKGHDKSSAHNLFQGLEGAIRCWIPNESNIFKESCERCYNFSIILNKLAILAR